MAILDKSLTFDGHMGYKFEDDNFRVSESLVAYGVTPASLDSDIELLRYARKGIETEMLWQFLKVIDTTRQDFEEFSTFLPKDPLVARLASMKPPASASSISSGFSGKEKRFSRTLDAFKQWLSHYHPVLGQYPPTNTSKPLLAAIC